MRLRLAVLIVLLLCSLGSVGQFSTYPERKGAVSDYAGKLTPTQISELSDLLRHYERQTSIEFAVVVVDNLGGQSAREYARGIGDYWGVGKAGRNNGIVLLWAPNERAYSLRIADGLSPDISDDDAGRITRENLLPNFRKGEYFTGLNETVRATMEQLGYERWEDRLGARAQGIQERQEKEAQAEWIIGGLIGIVGAATLIAVVLYRRRKRSQKLAEMADASAVITDSLNSAEQRAPQIQQLLSDLREKMPEQDASKLFRELSEQPKRIAGIRRDASALDFADLESYDEVVRTRELAESEASLLENMRQRVADIQSAKEQSRALMERLSSQSFEIQDVGDASKREQVNQLLSMGRTNYERARESSSQSMVDWLIIHSLLSNSQTQIQEAVNCSREEPCAPSFTSSASSYGGDSSAFGGGGGFSGGSGSDGTY